MENRNLDRLRAGVQGPQAAADAARRLHGALLSGRGDRAGRRPCAECRRADYNRFRQAFQTGQGWTNPPSAKIMDAALHHERTAGVRPRAPAAELPAGALVALDDGAWLKRGDYLLAWSFDGYGARREPPREPLEVLTPPATLAALRAGYACGIHPTAA